LQSFAHKLNRVIEDAKMKAFRDFCQHMFNPLHVFCRLRKAGFSLGAAKNVCRIYERGVYRFIL